MRDIFRPCLLAMMLGCASAAAQPVPPPPPTGHASNPAPGKSAVRVAPAPQVQPAPLLPRAVEWGPATLIPPPLRRLVLGEGLVLGAVGAWAALLLWIADRRKARAKRKR